jgi:flagellar motor switch protein FliN/FliY
MATPVTAEALTRVVAQAIADAWAATPLGAPASSTAAGPAEGPGWSVTATMSGAASGALRLWFDRAGAVACATRILALDAPAADDAVAGALADLVARVTSAIETTPEAAGVTFGDSDVKLANAPAIASLSAAWPDQTTARFAIDVDLAAAAASASSSADDARLEAVMDVDLPLVVRFGRAIMPLRSVADLSTGSVVDMGRSPDEPVELLVGERVIARGEVVIVGGNYGVRITELANGRRTAELEARS